MDKLARGDLKEGPGEGTSTTATTTSRKSVDFEVQARSQRRSHRHEGSKTRSASVVSRTSRSIYPGGTGNPRSSLRSSLRSTSNQRTSQRASQRSSFSFSGATMRAMWSDGSRVTYEEMGPALLAVSTVADAFHAEEAESSKISSGCRDILNAGPGAVLLLAFALVQGLLSTGLVYGFPSMVAMFQSEGVYQHLCALPSSDNMCTERALAFNWVFSAGSAMNASGALFAGLLVDLLGAKSGILLALVFDVIGSLLLGLSPAESDVVWPLAFLCYGFAACCGTLSNFSLANAFGSGYGLVISLLVSTSSMGAITMQGVALGYGAGLRRSEVFLIHVALLSLCFCTSLWFWPGAPLFPESRLRFRWGRPSVALEEDEEEELEVDEAGGDDCGSEALSPDSPLESIPERQTSDEDDNIVERFDRALWGDSPLESLPEKQTSDKDDAFAAGFDGLLPVDRPQESVRHRQVSDQTDGVVEKFEWALPVDSPLESLPEKQTSDQEEPQDSEEGQRSFCATALEALTSRQYKSILLFYLVNLFMYRCMQSWRSEELSWKDHIIQDAGGSGIDVPMQLNAFTSCGASVHVLVIPMFGWLVARFGASHAPFVVSAFLLIVWQSLRLIHTDWILPVFNVLAPVQRQ